MNEVNEEAFFESVLESSGIEKNSYYTGGKLANTNIPSNLLTQHNTYYNYYARGNAKEAVQEFFKLIYLAAWNHPEWLKNNISACLHEAMALKEECLKPLKNPTLNTAFLCTVSLLNECHKNKKPLEQSTRAFQELAQLFNLLNDITYYTHILYGSEVVAALVPCLYLAVACALLIPSLNPLDLLSPIAIGAIPTVAISLISLIVGYSSHSKINTNMHSFWNKSTAIQKSCIGAVPPLNNNPTNATSLHTTLK